MSSLEKLDQIRRSLASILEQAVLEMRPGSQLGFGPVIEDGYYCDFILSSPLGEGDFPEIEKRMRRLLRENASSLGEVPADAFRLRSIAGAYERGDSSRQVMSRIHVWAYASRKDLEEALARHEAALQRDHRKLGRELELFHFDGEVGQGLPLWLPNGTVIREELERFIKEFEFRAGYKRVSTPQIAHASLYRRSGHLEHYAESMFPPMLLSELPHQAGKEPYYLRPMNCPHHHRIFSSRPRSYRELPLRLAEYGQIYRYEDSGALSGLMRARGCCQNDAHIYCAEGQIRGELLSVLRLYEKAYEALNIREYRIRLSKWNPAEREKFVDNADRWEWSQDLMREILVESGLPFYEAEGEAAFYGPKIDIQFQFASGREETASTIQLDFVAGERMDLKFTGPDGREHRPYVIHRAPLGSHERFVAFLIEKHAGAWPLWLSPVQVRILPVAESHNAGAHAFAEDLREAFVRVEVDDSAETLPKRVRKAALDKVPYVVVLGDRELASGLVAVRVRGEKDPVLASREAFAHSLKEQIQRRENSLRVTF